MQIHDGFPTDEILGDKSNHESYLLRYNGSTRRLVDNYYDATAKGVLKLSSNPPKYRFLFNNAMPNTKIGDLVAVSISFSAGLIKRVHSLLIGIWHQE